MTFADNLRTMRKDIENSLREFLTRYAVIKKRPRDPDSIVVFVGCSAYWGPMKDGGKAVQTALLERYRRFRTIIKVLAAGHPAADLSQFAKSTEILLEVIEQSSTNWHYEVDDVLHECVEALNQQVGLLAGFSPAPTDAGVFVPDTNALLYNPGIENWAFDGHAPILIVLLPAVLAELDKLKIEHRNEDVRRKAEGLINRIKEYRRRGPLCDGVPLKRGVSRIMSVAAEPDFSKSLPWLDAQNADDRLLAGFIEVVRRFPHSAVTLVTRDINLQNKAEFARLPFEEPPPAP